MVRAIVGANWGDEGKGKLTDFLASQADIVVRFQGGSNAGHTIINDYGKFAMHQLPSGVFHDNVVNIIGNGVALSVESFKSELDLLKKRGVPVPKIIISDRAGLVMPYHILFDKYEEERQSDKKFGSTKTGIAPFYYYKFSKIGFQVIELLDDDSYIKDKLKHVLEIKNAILSGFYNKPEIIFNELFDKIIYYREILKPFVGDTVKFLSESVKLNKNILLEGQLGALKDTDFGIYPMVTSSNTIAGYGSVGAGIPPYEIKEIIAVVKAYSSAVGAGEFVSEIFGEDADKLRSLGGDDGEFGATTGRPRRMGWLDLVASKYGCKVQGATSVAFTVIDALSYLDEIPVCVGYQIDGNVFEDFPVTSRLKRAKPILKVLPGWKSDIKGIKRYDELPENCKAYIEFAEKKIGIPIKFISTGPKRSDVIFK